MTSRPSIGGARIGLLNTIFSASSSLTWAGVGLTDSRSFRKGCIVVPPMLVDRAPQRSANPLQEQVGLKLGASGDHRVGVEVIDSVSAEHLLVYVEVAGICRNARVAGKNQRGCVCNDRRRAAMFRTDIWNHLQCGSLDHCSRPKCIDSDAVGFELPVAS